MTDNATIIRDCYTAFAAGDLEPLRAALLPDFIEHSPDNPSGRDEWLAFMATFPIADAAVDLRRVIADDEHVVVHYHLLRRGDERGEAVVDIWRMVDGRIAEHWDVAQEVPGKAANDNGMF